MSTHLIRNLADPDGQLVALRELLRPGGTLAVHEYSVRDSRSARLVWHAAACWSIIIPAGRLVTGDAGRYRYLWRSVVSFDGADRLRTRLRAAGFTDVRSATMTGWQRGIVHTFVGRRPAGTPGQAE